MMYKCRWCGEIFEEPRVQYEHQGYCGSEAAWERWSVCPYCGDAGYEEYNEDEEYDEDEEEDEEVDM